MTSSSSSSSLFDGCDDSCGWVAAAVAALAYGSYGVPIKETVKIDNVHPLVLQSYKTLTMFVTCWLVLWMGVKVAWTPWGILSGFLWVLGGTGGIMAIRLAGMAVAVGTWATVMILVNFVWGILIFQEPVANVWGTMGAFCILTVGLVGMSYYSSPAAQGMQEVEAENITSEEQDTVVETSNSIEQYVSLDADDSMDNSRNRDMGDNSPTSSFGLLNGEEESMNDTAFYSVCGIALSQRVVGIMGAVFNGLMTGSSLIPLHYAKQEGFGGAKYMISFASGALIANTVIWIIYFGYVLVVQQSKRTFSGSLLLQQVFQNMPPWHVRQLWLPGFMAGVLLSIAMFGSILSVTYLGQGVGNSIIQSKILISGLWGIFFYKEITGRQTVTKWFLAAALTVAGILWLSHERLAATGGEGGDHRELYE